VTADLPVVRFGWLQPQTHAFADCAGEGCCEDETAGIARGRRPWLWVRALALPDRKRVGRCEDNNCGHDRQGDERFHPSNVACGLSVCQCPSCLMRFSTSGSMRGRPSVTPFSLALASPAFTRSRMIPRSNSAKTRGQARRWLRGRLQPFG